MILIRDAQGIIIGRFLEIEHAFFHVQEILGDKRKIVCCIEQDGKITHEGWILGEIKEVKK